MPVSSNTRSHGRRALQQREVDAVQLRARLEPDGEPEAGDVHEAQVAEIEDDGAVAVVQDGVHAALERGHGRAVELAVDLDVRRLADAPGCGAEAFDRGTR